MALDKSFTDKDLLSFVNAYSKHRAKLGVHQSLCHPAWNVNQKRPLKFSARCSRSHRGSREALKTKRREKLRCHKCDCKFSVIFTKKAMYKNPLRKGLLLYYFTHIVRLSVIFFEQRVWCYRYCVSCVLI